MLYQQVASADTHHIAVEWKLDSKIASMSRKHETDKQDTRHTRLQKVLKALDEGGLIGTVDKPSEYFRGHLRMRWGMFQDSGRPKGEPPLVYFGGKTNTTIIGLGGSTKHVEGLQGASSTGSRSATPYLVGHILEGLGINPEGWDSFKNGEYEVMVAIACATHALRPPAQNLEFVAKTLLTGHVRHPIYTNNEKTKCILGTPIYVAMVNLGLNDRL